MAITNKAQLSSNATHNGEKIAVTSESNIYKANDADTDVTLTKTSSRSWTIAGDKLTVTTTILNNTDIDIENIYFKDTLTAGASFVPNSVVVGSQPYPDVDPIAGATLPVTLGGSGMDMQIRYQVQTDEDAQTTSFNNSAMIEFEAESAKFQEQSNTINIPILNNELTILKQADKHIVKSGDELTYTLTISNTGDLTNTNLVLTDQIPDGTTFVENSVAIDGVAQTGANPASGLNLKDLQTNQSTTITFKVKIN